MVLDCCGCKVIRIDLYGVEGGSRVIMSYATSNGRSTKVRLGILMILSLGCWEHNLSERYRYNQLRRKWASL